MRNKVTCLATAHYAGGYSWAIMTRFVIMRIGTATGIHLSSCDTRIGSMAAMWTARSNTGQIVLQSPEDAHKFEITL